MTFNFSPFREKIKDIENRLSREFSAIRTGRATSAILDNVRVDSYGAKVPISYLAGVTIEDAKTIRITPWDKAQIKEIERAIVAADIGVSVNVDDQGVRISFPDLTSERRDALRKIANGKLEEARIALRQLRDSVWEEIQGMEKTGALSEDEKFRSKEEMQKLADEANKRFSEMAEKKEKEIAN